VSAFCSDPDGKEYYDFLSAYSAVNQGHQHPRIVKAMVDQLNRLALSSRAFYNDRLPGFSKFVTEYFGYERVRYQLSLLYLPSATILSSLLFPAKRPLLT
jgi:acetylornithine/succinyldiaminopimelate/putrescine aminotransferase